MSLFDQVAFYACLFLPAIYFLFKSDFKDAWYFVAAFTILTCCFLYAHHVLASAYAEKVVVGTSTEWDYVDHQGFLISGARYKYCEPVYQHESLYHAVLWLLPALILLIADGLHEVVRLTNHIAPSRYLRYGALLYCSYLLMSYNALNNNVHESRFYVSTEKPKCGCPPDEE